MVYKYNITETIGQLEAHQMRSYGCISAQYDYDSMTFAVEHECGVLVCPGSWGS